MNRRSWKWAIALALSGALHAGAAVLILPKAEPARIAGGASVEVAMAGNAFADQVAAGTTGETVEPVEDTVTESEPVEAETIAAEAVESAAPMTAETVTEPVRPETAPEREMDEVRKSETAEPEPAAETPAAVQSEEAPEAHIRVAPSQQASEPEMARASRPETAEEAREADSAAVSPSSSEAVEPATPSETVAALADVPTPTPRPAYEPPALAETEKPEPREARKAPVREQQASSGGQNEADTRQGTTEGRETAKAAQQGENTRARENGNAAVDNYPGKVMARLRRALRYPSRARRDNLSGEVHVSFTIAGGGDVGNIRVAKSSGSPVLDRAAADAVRRAAPFPAIPQGAGRNSWPFTAPLAFTR